MRQVLLKKMSKKSKLFLFISFTVTFLTGGALLVGNAIAHPSSVAIQATATATTSIAYLSAGVATSTYQFDGNGQLSTGKVLNMQTIDSGSLYIEFVASSSASSLGWQFQYSNNNQDWYGESAPFSTGTISGTSSNQFEASSTITHVWTPGVGATSTKVVAIPILPAQHERVVFFTPIGAAASGVYAEVDLKSLPSNP